MKRVILVYGVIAGTIVAAMMAITMPMYENGTLNHENGKPIGYTTMAVALSMIFFGVKSYRDNYLGGVVSFWKAVKIGMLITAIAAVMYATTWEFVYPTMSEEFMKEMVEGEIEEYKADGATPAEIEEARKDWEAFGELYKNPLVRFPVTIIEILPVGILWTLLAAALLRNKNFLPAQPKTSTNTTAGRQLA